MKKMYIIVQFTLLLCFTGTQSMEMQPQSTLLRSSYEGQAKKQDQIKIMELASAFILSRAIHIAAEIKIADYMVNGPQNITVLAQKSGMNQDALYRLLRLLASYGIFSHDASNNFSLTPLARQLVSTDSNSLWPWVTYHNDINRWTAYGDMKYSIETDKPAFNHMFGKGYFDFLSDNPELGAQFDEGMKNIAAGETAHIVNSYDFSPYHIITDIGGGKGGLLAEILGNKRTLSDCRGILFDLPYVEKSAKAYLSSMNLNNRVTFVPSTGFFEVPQGANLYILKRILHDWNDADSVTILKNCYNAMEQDTRLLIIENVVSQENVRDFSKDMDIAMMVLFGGKERTRTEWDALLAQANLEIIKIYKTPSMVSVIEVQKKQ